MASPAARATTIDAASLDARPAALALEALRRTWSGQLNGLIATVRELAVSDDTYEFVKRPNIPYVYEHYDREQLAAERIDSVLIVDLRGKPLFWRRIAAGGSRGFPEALRFLAELPPLGSADRAGVPTLAGAAKLVHGPTLLVAMPIYASSGTGAARGWLIATRALDGLQWSRYEELAQIPHEPLATLVRLEPHQSGLFALPDLQVIPSALFTAPTIREDGAPAPPNGRFSGRSIPLLTLLLAGTSVALVAMGMRRRQSGRVELLRTPKGGNPAHPDEANRAGRAHPTDATDTPDTTATDATTGGGAASRTMGAPIPDADAHDADASADANASANADASANANANANGDPPISGGFISGHSQDPLAARFAARKASFHYQPQIDLQTGRIAGVEAILSIPRGRGLQPAIELAAEIEASGHGMALAERRLHEACRAQSAWLQCMEHEFPIGVPVSQRTLANAGFLALVQGILADHGLTPSLLELQVEESVIGASASAMRVIDTVRDAGISVAVDGFNAAHSNLRLLSTLPISKLRVDPYLLLRVNEAPPAALLFAGIIGAARGLGIVVCATGIDLPELLSAVLQHGRPLAQGTALAPILTAKEFLELMLRCNVDTAVLPALSFGGGGLQLAPT
jgi:EAL domain-containing protein (putative c-di-GMP-specific phosphodiesterase class I)